MQEARAFSHPRKVRIILDKRFKQFFNFSVGDRGQGIFKGVVVGEKLEEETDCLIKTIEIEKIEIDNENSIRI